MINLEKKITDLDLVKKPEILNLVKKAAPIAEKYGLGNKPARVALVIDASGSMRPFYDNGQVQQLVNRAAALAALFDDDGNLDMFPFHSEGYMYGSVPPVQAADVVGQMIRKTGYGGTNYGKAFQKVHDFYWKSHGEKLSPIVEQAPPVYCIFVTDGATEQKKYAMDMVRLLSYRPCFIQAIALGTDYDSNAKSAAPAKKGGFFGGLFGSGSSGASDNIPEALQFLIKLDDEMTGNYIDNVDFFGTKTPTTLDDVTFFDRMMGEFPGWLTDPKVYSMLGQTSAASGWS